MKLSAIPDFKVKIGLSVGYANYSFYRTLIPLFVTTKDMGRLYGRYPVVTFENLVTNNRSVFESNCYLKFWGCSDTQNTPPPSYGLGFGDNFCRSDDPTNSTKALKEASWPLR